ncbi:hypothetical protein HPDFL43_00695 [Hoeflea phototrophica DFL-43]|jgi:hypothetical protein|uniref:Uncharacterized protein n=1 Tax=Hoeflea phototrophica (strain DSM 17068 / NCIMB 14078 / DFL-43) TaxID=411684 RepID=A9CYY9_HOEPD|nr:hypothetical protein [Hoeflea phototrophica]EDQ34670.1 hypothetical protein HPDFL43_00695 [Hoeflea phototrophica DFL-43]
MAQIEETDQANSQIADKAFRVNWMSSIVMTLAIAGVLLMQRPELAWVFISHVAISVLVISFARSRGILVKPYPLRQQNLAAYVTVSTAGFFATLIGAPELIEIHGSMIYILLALVMVALVLRGIVKSL